MSGSRARSVIMPVLFPVLLAGCGLLIIFLMQAVLSSYLITVVSFVFLNMILAVSLNITNGFTGLFSLGHPAFMSIGGYIAALLILPVSRKGVFLPELPQWLAVQEWGLLPAVIVGGVIAAVFAVLIGFPVLRLKGHYLAVATLGFIIIVQVLIRNMEGYTRGALGLNGLKPLSSIWWIYLWLVITVYTAWKLKFSSFGRTLFALRENVMAAECLGINSAWTKIIAFAGGAFFAGVTGGLWAHLTTVITPNSFSIILAFNLVVMVVVGGNGSITGAMTAAVLMTVVVEFLRPLEEKTGLYGLSQVLVSAALLGVLIFRPQGLFGSREPWFLMRAGRKNGETEP
ncbi:MAG: branched-chain amino acid ABC transporter permease [Spirochaetia bacterium]